MVEKTVSPHGAWGTEREKGSVSVLVRVLQQLLESKLFNWGSLTTSEA